MHLKTRTLDLKSWREVFSNMEDLLYLVTLIRIFMVLNIVFSCAVL